MITESIIKLTKIFNEFTVNIINHFVLERTEAKLVKTYNS